MALNKVILLLDELVSSYTTEPTAVHVRPLPVIVGWFGFAEIPVLELTVRSISLFAEGEIEAEVAVLFPSVSVPVVRLVADTVE
jgi:hypothetical protein